MQIQNSRFHKVWEIENKGNYSEVKLGDSRKEKDGTYTNCTWLARFVGKAHALAEDLGIVSGDTINVLSGTIFSEKGKNGTYFTKVVIFDFEVERKQEQKKKDDIETFDPEGFRALDDDIQF